MKCFRHPVPRNTQYALYIAPPRALLIALVRRGVAWRGVARLSYEAYALTALTGGGSGPLLNTGPGRVWRRNIFSPQSQSVRDCLATAVGCALKIQTPPPSVTPTLS